MKKLKIYLNNFNVISILFIFSSLFILKFLLETINYFTNNEYSILNMLNLFNINLIDFHLKLILILNIFFIMYSFFKKKFYSINLDNSSVWISFLLLVNILVLMSASTIVIVYLCKETRLESDDYFLSFLINSIYLLGLILQIILITIINLFMFFSLKIFSEQIKFKYIEKTSIDKYFDNNLLNKRKIYQGTNTIDGFLYKDVMLNIKDNIAVIKNEEFNLNVMIEYLELNNKIFKDLNEEDFKIIKLMSY